MAPLFSFNESSSNNNNNESTDSTTLKRVNTATSSTSSSASRWHSEEGECDFDENPTKLYSLIQAQDWTGVRWRLFQYPEEAQIYVFRCTDQGLVKWRLLPMHGAISNDAPDDVLETLVKAYRQSAQMPDDMGMLPIHWLLQKHRGPAAINLLLAAYPDSVDVRNHHGLTPYEMALQSTSQHREYYVRALQRGSPTFCAVTGTLSDLFCGCPWPFLDASSAFGLLTTGAENE